MSKAKGNWHSRSRKFLFVSLTGGRRAQIGAALFAHRAADALVVQSVGSEAITGIDDNVRLAMSEIGIDLGDAFSKPLTQEVLGVAVIVITMGRSVGEVEIPPSVKDLDWRVGDQPELISTKSAASARISSAESTHSHTSSQPLPPASPWVSDRPRRLAAAHLARVGAG